ncbi:hypothetical protein Csa_023560, partial [Cucumis sativus]
GSPAGERLHDKVMSSRQEAAARSREASSRQEVAAGRLTEGRSSVRGSVFTAGGCDREIDRGEIWRSRKRLHGRRLQQGD